MVVHKAYETNNSIAALCGAKEIEMLPDLIYTNADEYVSCPECLELMDLAVRDGPLI